MANFDDEDCGLDDEEIDEMQISEKRHIKIIGMMNLIALFGVAPAVVFAVAAVIWRIAEATFTPIWHAYGWR